MTTTYEERAKANGMSESRRLLGHAAIWHNMHVPQFGRIAEMVWGDQVAVLPDHRVFAIAQQQSKRSKSKVIIAAEVPETPAGQTVYRVGSVLVTVS